MDKTEPKHHREFREAAKLVWDFLSIRDRPKLADVIFILGGSAFEPVYKAAELYKSGLAARIAFISAGGTFGGEEVWGVSEVDKYKDLLLALDIHVQAIVYEEDPDKQTRNTLQEARRAVKFLKSRGLPARTIVLVARPSHQRRAYLTLVKQNPGTHFVNCPADEPFDSQDAGLLRRLVQEVERLSDYGIKKSDIERPIIPSRVKKAAATVGRYLLQNKEFTK